MEWHVTESCVESKMTILQFVHVDKEEQVLHSKQVLFCVKDNGES